MAKFYILTLAAFVTSPLALAANISCDLSTDRVGATAQTVYSTSAAFDPALEDSPTLHLDIPGSAHAQILRTASDGHMVAILEDGVTGIVGTGVSDGKRLSVTAGNSNSNVLVYCRMH